jgi:polyisoprenoid-binding protein YceI
VRCDAGGCPGYSPLPTQGEGPARRIKLTLTGPLKRRDFGIVWNNPLITIPDDLTVSLEVEATPA